jgi:hypothetical protein
MSKPLLVLESEDHGSECLCGDCGWVLEIYEEAQE